MAKGKESNAHLSLKRHAKRILQQQGFKPNQIFEEYCVQIEGKSRCEIDVAGISENKNIAIECGNQNFNPYNRSLIKPKFDKIIWIPFLMSYIGRPKRIAWELEEFKRYLTFTECKKENSNTSRIIKNAKLTTIGNSFFFLIPKQYMNNDLVSINKKYDVFIEESKEVNQNA